MSKANHHWIRTRLGDTKSTISTGPFGTMLHKSDYVEDGIPLVNPMNIVGSEIVPSTKMMVSEDTKRRLENYVLRKGDVVIARRGELGRCAVVTDAEDGWLCGTGSFFVRLPSSIDADYFATFFRSHAVKRVLDQNSIGTTMSNLNHGILNDLEIPVPPLKEQLRIMKILDEAFEGINIVKTNTERNIFNARKLFTGWLDRLFSERESHWEVKRIGDIAKTQYGLSESMNEDHRGYKTFRMGEVQNGRLVDTGRMKSADIPSSEFQKYKLKVGDVLFNRTNSYELVGKTGIFDIEGDYCFASYLVRVGYDRNVIDPKFLNLYMNSDGFQQRIKAKASRSINQANINASILSNELISFPPSLAEQQIAVSRLEVIAAESDLLQERYKVKLRHLEALKQSLLNKAFSGNL